MNLFSLFWYFFQGKGGKGGTQSGKGGKGDAGTGSAWTKTDIRVGTIVKAWPHPDSDKLWCEEIDIGEDTPRLIASGLRPYFSSPEDLEGRRVLVLANLKARKLVGFPSHGMVLCASNADHSDVKFVTPPADAAVGERVMWSENVDDVLGGGGFEMGEAAAENKLGKKKMFEKIASHLKTDGSGVVCFLGKPVWTSGGVVTSPIRDGGVS